MVEFQSLITTYRIISLDHLHTMGVKAKHWLCRSPQTD